MTLSSYIAAAVASARLKALRDGPYFGEIPACKGVWAHAKTTRRSKQELREVLGDWIVLKLRSDEALPAVHGKRLALPERVRGQAVLQMVMSGIVALSSCQP